MASKKSKIFSALLTLLITMVSIDAYSTTFTIMAANFSFSPSGISNAVVGDTIKWNWANGSHTTTCDGTFGSSRPSGAAPWNANLNSGSPTFTYILTVPGAYHFICVPHVADGMVGDITVAPSSINQVTEIVRGYELSQNYPNPFNPVTNIKFSIPNSSKVSLKIYNIKGEEVETLVNERLTAGSYRVDWNAVNFTSGVYYYKIQAEGFIETRKMLLIK